VMINKDPSKYTQLLVDQKILSPQLAGTFEVPPFVTAGVPTQAHWDDVLAWAKARGLLSKDISYSDSVTNQYLP
jgi:NitT/TauT family transport system substrate-binding protein